MPCTNWGRSRLGGGAGCIRIVFQKHEMMSSVCTFSNNLMNSYEAEGELSGNLNT